MGASDESRHVILRDEHNGQQTRFLEAFIGSDGDLHVTERMRDLIRPSLASSDANTSGTPPSVVTSYGACSLCWAVSPAGTCSTFSSACTPGRAPTSSSAGCVRAIF